MKASLELDPASVRNFQSALEIYRRATRKDVPEVVNRAAINLAFRSAQFTPKADIPSSIGKIRNIYAFTNWVYTQRGIKHPTKARRDAAFSRLIRQRVSVAGFIRRGWAQAGKRIQQQSGIRGSVRIPGLGGRRGKGTGTMARQAILSFAEIVNFSTSKSVTSASALKRYGGEGLQEAIRFVTGDMMEYARKKLDQRAREFNRA